MAQPQDHVEGISAPPASKLHAWPPVLTSTLHARQLRPAVKVVRLFLDSDGTLKEFPDSDPHFYVLSSCHDSIPNSSHAFHLPQDGRAPPTTDFTEELTAAVLCSSKGIAVEALPTGIASSKRIFGSFGLGTDCGSGPRHPQDDIGWISALAGDVGVDLELGYPLDVVGGIGTHLFRAERHAYYNQELLFHKQWKAYIKDLKIVNSGSGDSILIQPVITLLGEAFGGALAHALSSSSEPSQLKSVVQGSILIGVGLTVAGIGLRRFKRRLSDNVMKVGAMGTALAIIVAFAGLLPPWLAWSVGAVASTLVAAGLAMI